MSDFWSWEGPKNWWHAAPEGAWTFIEPRFKYGYWAGMFAILLFGWMIVNTPYFLMGLIYLSMLIIYAIIYYTEMQAPKKVYIAVIMPRKTPTYLLEVFIGLVAGVAFALLYPISGVAFPLLAFTPIHVANFLLGCIVIPMVEEYAWGGIMTAATAEDFGIIPGLLFTSLMFSFFHWAVVGAVASTLVMLAIFRLIASTAVLWRRNLLIGMAMHMAVNTIGFWAAMVAGGIA